MKSCTVTIGFSAHHLEVLPVLRVSMQNHAAIVLEGPPSPGFPLMLDHSLAIDDYLMEVDSQFPKSWLPSPAGRPTQKTKSG